MTVDPALVATAPPLESFADEIDAVVDPDIPLALEMIFAYQEERRMARRSHPRAALAPRLRTGSGTIATSHHSSRGNHDDAACCLGAGQHVRHPTDAQRPLTGAGTTDARFPEVRVPDSEQSSLPPSIPAPGAP